MSLDRLRWYLARLSAMSPREVMHRVGEARKKHAYAKDMRGWAAFSGVGDGGLGDLAWLGRRLAQGADVAAPGVALFDAGFTEALGRRVALDFPAAWFADPVSGGAWPGAEAYCFDVDVRTTGAGKGDVKFVWEVNRLQFLHPLCAAIAAEPDEARVAQVFDVLAGWAEANPPYRGVNWFSGIELAMRLVSFALVVAATPPALMTPARRGLIRKLVAAHGFWLARYPSRFSSANNHLMAEGMGLLIAGLLCPDVPGAAAWAAEGRAVLEHEAALQMYPDGVGGEQSPTYQAFTMEMLALGALVAREAGAPLAPVVDARLCAGATFLRALMDDAGAPPRIGDDDEGRVIACPPDREPRYVASIVAAVAGLAGDPALAPPARDGHLRDAVFGAPETGYPAPAGVSVFHDGGYSIMRGVMGGRAAVLTVDHGPLGYLSLAAHGHADALALWLSLDDIPVLVDAGTYLYHSGGALRNALRGTAAHNTVVVEGASQSLPSSAFSWSRRTDARLDDAETGADWRISASHAGYKSRFGVVHRRDVTRTARGFAVADRLEGGAFRRVEIGWLIGPSVEIVAEGAGFRLMHGGEALALLTPPEGLTVRLAREERETGRGLYSPRFGEVSAATMIVAEGMLGAAPAVTEFAVFGG